MKSVRPTFGRMLWRAARKKCPVCGGGRLFTRWFTMKAECPTCGFHFEREEGFFLGAFVINIAATEGAMFIALIAGMGLTMPNPPLGLLLALGLISSVLVPLFTYPFSKTIWSAIDLGMHPLDAWEEAGQVMRRGR